MQSYNVSGFNQICQNAIKHTGCNQIMCQDVIKYVRMQSNMSGCNQMYQGTIKCIRMQSNNMSGCNQIYQDIDKAMDSFKTYNRQKSVQSLKQCQFYENLSECHTYLLVEQPQLKRGTAGGVTSFFVEEGTINFWGFYFIKIL